MIWNAARHAISVAGSRRLKSRYARRRPGTQQAAGAHGCIAAVLASKRRIAPASAALLNQEK
jgi:hypothetical protein